MTPESLMRGFFRPPAGPGWALVGDACHFKHPGTAQGIADAVEQAIYVAKALDAGDPRDERSRRGPGSSRLLQPPGGAVPGDERGASGNGSSPRPAAAEDSPVQKNHRGDWIDLTLGASSRMTLHHSCITN